MSSGADPRLFAWQNFYVIVGSAGAALIGVQFVVITLMASMRRAADADSIGAFGTPTIMHLASALLVSATMTAPWPSLFPASVALAVFGVCGLICAMIAIHRARRQTSYQPVGEDWLWYAILPCCIYTAIALTALFLQTAAQAAMFAIGASALALLLLAIHNAWDAVTHMVVTGSGATAETTTEMETETK